jgi:hypothetical protein
VDIFRIASVSCSCPCSVPVLDEMDDPTLS